MELEVIDGMKEWRQSHPKATLREMEAELDQRLARMRARLLEEIAASSSLVRLGAWMPFEEAAGTLAGILRVRVSGSEAVRTTEAAGAAYVAIQAEEVAELERKAPPAPAGAEQMVFSGDGAMVPVLHGEWKEVRTLVIGEVGRTTTGEVRTQAQSYFSRLASAEEFTRLALVETHRRGVENSRRVGAVVDGAEWLQGLIDSHAPQAVRILDFAHAAQRIAAIASQMPDPAPSPQPGQPRSPKRPAPDHPWRRSPIGSARYRSTQSAKS